MKIKYFSYIAELSFKTSHSGERLFYSYGGIWSKPYIIPDQEIEKRLFKKHLWVLRIFLGALILGQPFLFIAVPNIIESPLGFILYLVGIILLHWFVNWLVFRKDLSMLSRANTRTPFPAFYRDTAKKHGIVVIVLGFLTCIGFVLLELWMIIKSEINPFIGWVSIIFIGFCSVAWGYILVLKMTMLKHPEVNDNETEA